MQKVKLLNSVIILKDYTLRLTLHVCKNTSYVMIKQLIQVGNFGLKLNFGFQKWRKVICLSYNEVRQVEVELLF